MVRRHSELEPQPQPEPQRQPQPREIRGQELQETPEGKGWYFMTVYDLIVAGFSCQEVDALLGARARYLSGELNDLDINYRQITFARWLYDHGRIGG